jgi:hypothetical protein
MSFKQEDFVQFYFISQRYKRVILTNTKNGKRRLQKIFIVFNYQLVQVVHDWHFRLLLPTFVKKICFRLQGL